MQGILGKSREAIVHAMMLDPLSAAVCSPAEIRKMAGELFRADRKRGPLVIQEAGPADFLRL